MGFKTILAALKNKDTDTLQNSSLQGYSPGGNQFGSNPQKSRANPELSPLKINETFEPKDLFQYDNRENGSVTPFSSKANGIRFETENLELKSREGVITTKSYKTINSSRILEDKGKSPHTRELSSDSQLPQLPEVLIGRRGYSSPMESNFNSFLKKSTQPVQSNPGSISTYQNFGLNFKALSNSVIKPFSFSLNSPNSLISPKLKPDSIINSMPQQFSMQSPQSKKSKEPYLKGFERPKPNFDSIKRMDNELILPQTPEESPNVLPILNPSHKSAVFSAQKSPIKVLDMGISQMAIANRTKEKKFQKMQPIELQELKYANPKNIKEIRFKSEPASVRSTIGDTDNPENTNKIEKNGINKEFRASSKGKFPKDIFCLNLKKKVCL